MDIKDYIHFYIGQKHIRELHRKSGEVDVIGPMIISGHDVATWNQFTHQSLSYNETLNAIDKPILRKIESMTEEEMNECGNLDYDFSNDPELNQWSHLDFDCILTPNQFTWMLKRGFDLWGFIDVGLAVDAAAISQQNVTT